MITRLYSRKIGSPVSSREQRFILQRILDHQEKAARLPMLETPLERQILVACLNRQPHAWELFLEQLLPLLHHVVLRSAGQCGCNPQETDIEDVLSAILTHLIENDLAVLRRFRGESKLSTYLVVVARRMAQLEWSKMANHSDPQAIHETDSQSLDSVSSADEVDVLLEKLKPMEREAIRLHHLEGCSYSEVARQLKVPLNSIGPLLSRARRKIQATRTEKPQ